MPFKTLSLFSVLISLLFFPTAPSAQESEELNPVDAMQLYCIDPVTTGKDPATLAAQEKMSELPPAKAAAFSKTGGRVFAIPGQIGNSVLIVHSSSNCSVAIRKMEFDAFWKDADAAFNPPAPFQAIKEENLEDGSMQKQYTSTTTNKAVLLVRGGKEFKENGMQALMTFSLVSS